MLNLKYTCFVDNIRKILMTLTFLLVSCGYEKPENDKYPNLPLFPNINSSKFEIVKFPYRSYNYLGITKGYLYTTAAIDYKEGYGGKKHLIIYDESLNIVKKIPVDGNVSVAKNGDFYLKKEEKVEKYSYPNFESITIKKSPLNRYSIYDSKAEEIAKLEKADSTFNSGKYVINIISKKLDSVNKIKRLCYIKIMNSTILKFDNEEVWFDDYDVNFQSFKNCSNSILSNDNINNPKLKIFDNAKLGNKSSANRYVGHFYQYGMEYFNLVREKDTLKFKFNSRYLDGESIKEYKGFNSNQVILRTEWENKLYIIK